MHLGDCIVPIAASAHAALPSVSNHGSLRLPVQQVCLMRAVLAVCALAASMHVPVGNGGFLSPLIFPIFLLFVLVLLVALRFLRILLLLLFIFFLLVLFLLLILLSILLAFCHWFHCHRALCRLVSNRVSIVKHLYVPNS